MPGILRAVAVLMWWLSFVLPIAPSSEGRSVLGFEAFIVTTGLLFGAFPFSLFLVIPPASWATNYLPLRQTFRLFQVSGPSPELRFASGALIINLTAYMLFLRELVSKASPLYKYPAIYLWLGSFFLLWLSTLWPSREEAQ